MPAFVSIKEMTWLNEHKHDKFNFIIIMRINWSPVESSGVHGWLRAGFSEVGPEVVIILTLGLDDLLLTCKKWQEEQSVILIWKQNNKR